MCVRAGGRAHVCLCAVVVWLCIFGTRLGAAWNNDFSIKTHAPAQHRMQAKCNYCLFACWIYMQMFLFYEWITIIYSNSAPFPYTHTHTHDNRSSLYFFAIVIVRTNTDGKPRKYKYKTCNEKLWHSKNCASLYSYEFSSSAIINAAQRNKCNKHSGERERVGERNGENGIKGNFYGNEEQTYGISIVCLFNTEFV